MHLRPVRQWQLSFLQLVCVLLAGIYAAALKSAPYSEDAVKAAFIYRFGGYVDWPPEALTAQHFTIAVLGAEGVAQELSRLLPQHSIRDLPARLRVIRNVKELGNAQILYIGKGYMGNVNAAIDTIAEQPVLVITDDMNGLDRGAVINFVPLDRRVRFEISVVAATRANLRIGADLLSVAARVRSAPVSSEAGCIPGRPGEQPASMCSRRVASL